MSIIVQMNNPSYSVEKATEILLEAQRFRHSMPSDQYAAKLEQAISLIGLAKVQHEIVQAEAKARPRS